MNQSKNATPATMVTPEVVALSNGRFGYRQTNGEVVGSYLDREEAAEVMAHYVRECRADGSVPATMEAPNGYALASLEADTATLQPGAVRDHWQAVLEDVRTLTAKAAALDALVEAVGRLNEMHRDAVFVCGADDEDAVDAALGAVRAALKAAKLAQVSK